MEPNEMIVIPEKRRITKSAFFVLLTPFFEGYGGSGISSVLLLFINLKLRCDRDTSTAIFHTYEFLAYFIATFGSIIADSWLGIYKTFVWAAMICAAGCIILAVGVVDALHLPIEAFSIVGLVLITIGLGFLSPLGTTYGAQQYKPSEVESIALFFSLYYFVINCGSITSRFVNPILRQDVNCFGNDDCFALAFGFPGVSMIIVALAVMIAKRYSETSQDKQAKGTTLMNVFACIWLAIVMKIKSRKFANTSKKSHWLDYSEEKYGKMLVSDTKVILNVLVLYIPIPIFWALFLQQYSRWVFQAVKMNSDLGFYTIKADQFSVLSPILVLVLIPVFDYAIYPLLSKVGIRTDLQKINFGGVLAGVAFVISAIIESQIDNEYLHMTWLIPQYSVMTMAEILIQIQLINFSYSEAPKSTKSVFQAFRLLAVGLGSLIAVIVAGSQLIESQMYEFLFFAGLMFVDMAIFGFLARSYKPLRLIVSDNKMDENMASLI